MGNTVARALVTAAIVLIGSASAVTAAAADDGTYAPVTPREPSLEGSVVTTNCEGGTPAIAYRVRTVGRDEPITAASLWVTDGESDVTLSLPGRVTDAGTGLRGEIAWPGTASADGQSRGTDLAWMRGAVSAQLQVDGLRLPVPLEYPAAACAASPASSQLAATGGVVPMVAASAGVASLAVGAVVTFFALRRRSAALHGDDAAQRRETSR